VLWWHGVVALHWVCVVAYSFIPVLTLFCLCPFPTHRLIADYVVPVVAGMCTSNIFNKNSVAYSFLALHRRLIVVVYFLFVRIKYVIKNVIKNFSRTRWRVAGIAG